MALNGKAPENWGDTAAEGTESFQRALAEAVRTEGFGAYFKASAWVASLDRTYYEQDRSNEHSDYYGSTSSLTIAWQLSACSKHPGCNFQRLRDMLKAELYPYIYQEAISYVAQIDEGKLPGIETDADYARAARAPLR